ncbi:TPA: hypothetical protein DEP94_02190 [Candidatus Nomurabacteria bacterium]|nr:hypothetical protein [Candidatus Nomurabacteria bacterium]
MNFADLPVHQQIAVSVVIVWLLLVLFFAVINFARNTKQFLEDLKNSPREWLLATLFFPFKRD